VTSVDLDYRVPNFTISIGKFNLTPFLDEFEIALPMHEINDPLVWRGRFKISRNRAAILGGLTDNDFDPLFLPGRWRPGQQQVRAVINGRSLPVLRVEKYAYNPQSGTGEGTLTQIIELVATDRPADRQLGGAIASSVGSVPYTSVGSVADRLIHEAFRQSTINPAVATGGLRGTIYGRIYSRNPIADAQKLFGTQWQWLWVETNEEIRSVSGDSRSSPSLFTRSLSQIEWEPDIDHVVLAADNVIVTGSRQQPAKVKCAENAPPLDPNLDRKGRPKLQKAIEYQPFNKVFTKNNGSSTAPTISEIKWIFYQYPDDLVWDGQIQHFLPTEGLFDLQSDYPIEGAPIDAPYQIVTVLERPTGRVFPSTGTAGDLIVASLEYQSERRKAKWVPAGVLNPKLGTLADLRLESREILTTKPVIAGAVGHGGTADPRTGKAQCLEPAPVKEERQPLPDHPLESVPIEGSARVRPLGWSPVTKSDLVMEVGFLPDTIAANDLAQKIATRESWRRDTVKITMPIPDEWLVEGCPPLGRCYLHDGHWQMDGLIISIRPRDGEAKFAFSAARIDRLGVPLSKHVAQLDVRTVPYVDIAVRPRRSIAVEVRAATGVQFDVTTTSGGGGGGGGSP
jgi:hypothetical protein